jgi:hypothetical protein
MVRTNFLSVKFWRKKEICTNFAVAPQTAKVTATKHGRCLVLKLCYLLLQASTWGKSNYLWIQAACVPAPVFWACRCFPTILKFMKLSPHLLFFSNSYSLHDLSDFPCDTDPEYCTKLYQHLPASTGIATVSSVFSSLGHCLLSSLQLESFLQNMIELISIKTRFFPVQLFPKIPSRLPRYYQAFPHLPFFLSHFCPI